MKRLMLAEETVVERGPGLVPWVKPRGPSPVADSGDGDVKDSPEGTTVTIFEGGFVIETLSVERAGMVAPEVTLTANGFGDTQEVTEVLAAVKLTTVKP